MKIYISGPIGGQNITRTIDRFENVARELKMEGHSVVVPTDVSHWRLSWSTYIQMAFDILKSGDIDQVYMLSGWQESKGATLERYMARVMGIPVTYQNREDRERYLRRGQHGEDQSDN